MELAQDEAIQAADTLLLIIPSQLGVDYTRTCSQIFLATWLRSSAGAEVPHRRKNGRMTGDNAAVF